MIKERAKKLILNEIDYLVETLIDSDRRDDEDLPFGEIERCVEAGGITIAEMVQRFEDNLRNQIKGVEGE